MFFRNGFEVSSSLADASASLSGKPHLNTPNMFERTFYPRGVPLEKQTIIKNENYAKFLEKAARVGSHGKKYKNIL